MRHDEIFMLQMERNIIADIPNNPMCKEVKPSTIMNSVCRNRLMHSSVKGMQRRISLLGACHLPLADLDNVTCDLTG